MPSDALKVLALWCGIGAHNYTGYKIGVCPRRKTVGFFDQVISAIELKLKIKIVLAEPGSLLPQEINTIPCSEDSERSTRATGRWRKRCKSKFAPACCGGRQRH